MSFDPLYVHEAARFRILLRRESHGDSLFDMKEKARLLYNAGLQEWIEGYRWACKQSSRLGFPRYDRDLIEALDPTKLDDRRRLVREELLAWSGSSFVSQDASLTLKAQSSAFPGEELVCDLPTQVRRWVLARLHDALDAFYARCKANKEAAAKGGKWKPPGYPRFRRYDLWKTFGFEEFVGGITFDVPSRENFMREGRENTANPYRTVNAKLTIPGIDRTFRVAMHRPFPEGATIRGCTLTQDEFKGWLVSFVLKVPRAKAAERNEDLHDVVEEQVYAWDANVDYQADSQGNLYANPKEGEKRSRKLRREARKVNRSRKGSNRREKRKVSLGRAYRAQANARRTGTHAISRAMANAAIAMDARVLGSEDIHWPSLTKSAAGTVEDPGKNVAQKRGLNRSLQDANPGEIRRQLEYKVEMAGIRAARVPAAFTTIDCYECKEKVPKSGSVRIHRCPYCGHVAHRDCNAACNIRCVTARTVRKRAPIARGNRIKAEAKAVIKAAEKVARLAARKAARLTEAIAA